MQAFAAYSEKLKGCRAVNSKDEVLGLTSRMQVRYDIYRKTEGSSLLSWRTSMNDLSSYVCWATNRNCISKDRKLKQGHSIVTRLCGHCARNPWGWLRSWRLPRWVRRKCAFCIDHQEGHVSTLSGIPFCVNPPLGNRPRCSGYRSLNLRWGLRMIHCQLVCRKPQQQDKEGNDMYV